MNQSTKPSVIAVINSNDDLVRIVREMLEDEGYTVATIHISEIRKGEGSLLRFLADHDPSVLIYDIAPPYRENWTFLQLLQRVPEFSNRSVVVTTVNKTALEAQVGAVVVFEIVGTRDNFAPVLNAVNDAVKKSPQSPAGWQRQVRAKKAVQPKARKPRS